MDGGATMSTRAKAVSVCYLMLLPLALCATLQTTDQYGTRVSLWPPMGHSPLAVQVRASVEVPTQDWYCPSMTVRWDNGLESFRESDCDPFEELPDHYRYTETIWGLLGPGHHDIVVRLKQGAKVQEYHVTAEVAE